MGMVMVIIPIHRFLDFEAQIIFVMCETRHFKFGTKTDVDEYWCKHTRLQAHMTSLCFEHKQ